MSGRAVRRARHASAVGRATTSGRRSVTGRPSYPPLESDPLHAAAVEAACDLDRSFFERHPGVSTDVRPALEHEGCVASYACRPVERSAVWQFEPGLRARWRL